MKQRFLFVISPLVSRLFKAVRRLFGKKIKVLFLINDPYTNNFISLYRILEKDKRFKILVVAYDHLGYDFAPAFSRILISKILTEANIKHRVGISILGIAKFAPDFIFTSNLYDLYSRNDLRSEYLSAVGRTVSIHYSAPLMKWEGLYEFCNDVPSIARAYKIFVQSDLIFPGNNKFEPVGYLKLDEYIYDGRKPLVFKGYSVAWKPRWTNQDDSSAEKLIDFFQEISSEEQNILNIIMHPFFEVSFQRTTKGREVLAKLNKMRGKGNVNFVEGPDYLDYVLGSDVYVADISGTVAEFLLTERPIVCVNSNSSFNTLGEKIINAAYLFDNPDELKEILANLQNNLDPKRELRKGLFKDLFHVTSQSAAAQIRDCLLKYSK